MSDPVTSSTHTHTRRGLLAVGGITVAGVVMGSEPAHAVDYISTAEKGVAGGVARIDSTGLVLDATSVGIDSRTVLDNAVVVAAPSRFNDATTSPATVIDPQGQVDSTKGFTAALAATPEGGTLVVPAGKYILSSALTISRSITLQLYGTSWEIRGDNPFVQFIGALGATQAITAVAATTFTTTSSDGTTTTTTPATQVTLGSAAPDDWKRGCFVKIVADDFVVGARSAAPEATSSDGKSQARVGQIMEVKSVSGSTVVLDGKLRKPFTVNIRAASFMSSSIRIRGGHFRRSDDDLGKRNTTSSLIKITSAISPEIDGITVRGTVGPVVLFTNCLNPQFRNSVIAYAQNDPSPNIAGGYDYKLGYGVQIVNCHGGNTMGNQFFDVRHAFTDDVQRIPANQADLYKYGWPHGHVFQSNLVQGTTSAAVSPHSGGERHQFLDNTITNVPAGFVLRGDQHLVRGNRIEGCTGNALETSGENGGKSTRHQFVGNDIEDCVTAFLIDGTQTDASNAAVRESTAISIVGNRVSGIRNRIGGMRRATLHIRGNSFSLGATFANNDRAAGLTALITAQDSRIDSYDNLIDTADAPLTGSSDPTKTVPVFDLLSARPSEIVGDVALRNRSDPPQFVSLVTRSGTSSSSIVRLRFRASFGWMVGYTDAVQYIPNPATLSSSSSTAVGSYVRLDPIENNLSNAVIALSPDSTVDTVGLGARIAATSTDGAITVQIAPTSNLVLSAAGWGNAQTRDGQLVQIHTLSSAKTITIPGSAPFAVVSNASNGTDVVLAPGESILLSLSGGRARQVGAGATTTPRTYRSASSDPGQTPSETGSFYIRLDTGRTWISKGVTDATDWVPLN